MVVWLLVIILRVISDLENLSQLLEKDFRELIPQTFRRDYDLQLLQKPFVVKELTPRRNQ